MNSKSRAVVDGQSFGRLTFVCYGIVIDSSIFAY